MATSVRIIPCTDPAGLHHHYPGQSKSQPAYIELDLREGTLSAGWNAEFGNTEPRTVRNGLDRRYGIPILTGDAANRVMQELAPLAEQILGDWEEYWDGNNTVARLGPDAQAAEGQIETRLGLRGDTGERRDFPPADLVTGWDVDGAINGFEAEEYGITAETTDERLAEIEAEIAASLVDVSSSPVIVLLGVGAYLRDLRDALAADQD